MRPIPLYFIFEKSISRNWIFNLQKSILKLIFAGYTGRKKLAANFGPKYCYVLFGPSVVYFILTIRVWLFLNWYETQENLTVCTMYCASSFQSSKEGSISWVSQLHTACRTECPT
jgi:hypothetical protein